MVGTHEFQVVWISVLLPILAQRTSTLDWHHSHLQLSWEKYYIHGISEFLESQCTFVFILKDWQTPLQIVWNQATPFVIRVEISLTHYSYILHVGDANV